MHTLSGRQVAGLVVIATTGLAGLTSCTINPTLAPSPRTMLIGVSSTDGRPALEVRFCAGQRTAFIALKSNAVPTAPPADGDTSGNVWDITNQTDQRSNYTVEFGTVPPGWVAKRSGPVTLAPDVEYYLLAHTGPKPSVDFTFTGGDVAALTDDQVLTVGKDDVSTVVLSKPDFEAEAKRRC